MYRQSSHCPFHYSLPPPPPPLPPPSSPPPPPPSSSSSSSASILPFTYPYITYLFVYSCIHSSIYLSINSPMLFPSSSSSSSSSASSPASILPFTYPHI